MALRRVQKLTIILGAFLISLVIGTTVIGIPPTNTAPELGFPISETDNIAGLSAYHTPDWGESGVFHNGIDLVISANVTIIAPVSGIVVSVSESYNQYGGNTLFEIGIAINWVWTVSLVLEPMDSNDTINAMQRNSIQVSLFESITKGDEIATLIYADSYSHLHFMLRKMAVDTSAYDYSNTDAQAVFNEISDETNSTIQYDYEEPNPTTTPLGLGLISVGLVMAVLIILSIRKRN